jgi:membrane fusion protein, multidrug efflux system
MTDSSNDQSMPAPNGRRRKLLLAAVLGAFAAAGIAYGTYWAEVARYVQTTDDAYVAGNVVQITPQVAGTVVAIKVDDTQFVRAGDELVRLDSADARIALRRREAQLGQTVREVRGLFTAGARDEAVLAGREIDLARAQADLARRQNLARSGAISGEELQHAREAVRGAQTALAAAREKLAGNRALTDRTAVASHPSVERAAAQVRTAFLDYQRSVIPAPVSGFVARRNVQLGQRVSPGSPLMAIVPLDQVWVEANFKESQLKDIRVGQPVRLVADANGVTYHGSVAGFGAGTGAAFALLPPQNASGNWIKVVQRLPLRVSLDAKELAAHPLAIGLSMEVRVDVHRTSGGQLVAAAGADPDYRTAVFTQRADLAGELIARIIERNGGGRGGTIAAK